MALADLLSNPPQVLLNFNWWTLSKQLFVQLIINLQMSETEEMELAITKQ